MLFTTFLIDLHKKMNSKATKVCKTQSDYNFISTIHNNPPLIRLYITHNTIFYSFFYT